MKKRWFAMVLALALVFALGVNAASADDDTAEPVAEANAVIAAADADVGTEEAEETAAPVEPDAEGTLSFGNIASQMMENNFSMLALQESIDDIESHDYDWRENDLRDQLNGIADLQWQTMMAPSALSAIPGATPASIASGTASASVYSQQLQTQYNSLRKQFDDLRDGETQKDDAASVRQYQQMQDLMIMGAETLYIAILSMEESDAALTRKVNALDRSLAALRVTESNGLVSALNVQQAENGLAQLQSGQQTLRMTEETTLLQLKAMVGAELGEPLELVALPKVTASQLNAMNVEEDLARAMEVSYDLYDAQKQVDDFKRDYYDEVMKHYSETSKAFEVSQVKHGLQALKYSNENAKQSFELKFRTLYAQVNDDAQKLDAAKSALALEEKNYAVSALKCQQGTISKNALADAADTLAEAKDTVSSAERDLFTAYRNYYWAVEHGILN